MWFIWCIPGPIEDGAAQFAWNPHLANVHHINGPVCGVLILNGSSFLKRHCSGRLALTTSMLTTWIHRLLFVMAPKATAAATGGSCLTVHPVFSPTIVNNVLDSFWISF